MADIFLSYASSDRVKARTFAELFESVGWSVWLDQYTEGGEEWEHRIEHELQSARCVVVLWTRRSILSEWVVREARAARSRAVLLPILLEPVDPPGELGEVQATAATAWIGDERSFELRPFMARLAEFLESEPPSLDDAPTKVAIVKLSRIEVVEAVFNFCAARLDFFRMRNEPKGADESTLKKMRNTYDALCEILAPVSSDDVHKLIVENEGAFTP